MNAPVQDNVLGSTVVRTIKNLRRQIQTTDDAKLSKPQSAALDDDNQLKTPLSINSEDELKDEATANKNTSGKRASERTTSNVFSRLAAKKSLSSGTRREKKTRDMTLDFFDKQYKNAIKGLIEILMTRNKKVIEFVETSGIQKGYIIKRVVQNPHFMICLTALLNQMYKKEEVEGDLKNISPSSISKLADFFIEKIQYEVNLDNLDVEMKDHSTALTRINKNRMEALKEKLASFRSDPE